MSVTHMPSADGRSVVRSLSAACLVAAVLSGVEAAAVDFAEIARFNLDSTATDPDNPDPQDIGTNPIAVAWNGSQLYVAGYNGTGDTVNNLDVAIVEVLGADGTGVVATPTFGTAFGAISTPTFRAYTGLDLASDGSGLAATHDNGQFGDNTFGVQLFDPADNSRTWSDASQGFTGPTFDPGFSGDGTGSGVATGGQASGRRHLYDETSGTLLFGPSGGAATPGMIWTSFEGGFLPRDMDFDPETGDIYVRHNNRLTTATRTGGNALADATIIFDPYNDPTAGDGDNFLGQNVAFLSNTIDGDLLILNERDSNAADQAFADVVKVIDPTGVEQSASFALLNGDSIADGGALYDFDFDPASQTLALLDFTNRNVHIFQIGAVLASADFNADASVTGEDFLLWQRGYPIADGTGLAIDGDANGDGDVGSADLAVWEAQYGNLAAAGVAATAVPEPTGLLLTVVLASLATLGRTTRA